MPNLPFRQRDIRQFWKVTLVIFDGVDDFFNQAGGIDLRNLMQIDPFAFLITRLWAGLNRYVNVVLGHSVFEIVVLWFFR